MPTLKRADQEQLEKAQDLLGPEVPHELGFVKSLFFGRIKPEKILPYPKQDPAEAERTEAFIAKVDAFLKTHVDPDEIDAAERIPQDVIDGLAELGVLGMTVPTEYGGLGFSHTAYCRVLEHISAHCASTAVLVGAHQSIGLKALLLMGAEAQKQQFLPDLAAGRKLAAFCLSEPEVGSDAANVQTTARLSEDGSHWILNGQKRYATNAAIAGMMTVMAKTPVSENGKTRDKVTAFIVTPDLPGFEVVSPNRSKCGVRGSWQATLRFTDMRVPADRVLGEVGKGLRVALSVLDFGRCTLSAGCVGGAKKALRLAVEHVKQRRQFGRPVAEFHLVKQKIARMAELTFAMEAMTYLAAGLVDRHADDVIMETAIAKLFCSEGLWQIVDDAVQLWGGEGYMREHGLERMLRDARINRIVEGTTEVMTAFVALMGMKGVGETFEGVLRASKHPIGNFGRLAAFARDQFRDVVIGRPFDGLRDELRQEGHTVAKLTTQLAREVGRLLRTHREGILDLQLLQQRVSHATIDLFASAAVLSKLQAMLDAHGPADEGTKASAGRHTKMEDGGWKTEGSSAGGNGHAHGDGNGHAVSGAIADTAAHDDPDLRRALTIGRAFCRHAAERVRHDLGSLFVNSDKETLAAADAAMANVAPG